MGRTAKAVGPQRPVTKTHVRISLSFCHYHSKNTRFVMAASHISAETLTSMTLLPETDILRDTGAAARQSLRVRNATRDDFQAMARLHATSWRLAYRGALSDAYLSGDIE